MHNRKEDPLITGVDGIKALQIAEAAMQSSTKCIAVNLEE